MLELQTPNSDINHNVCVYIQLNIYKFLRRRDNNKTTHGQNKKTSSITHSSLYEKLQDFWKKESWKMNFSWKYPDSIVEKRTMDE